MKTVIFLCLVLVSFVRAEFNECITDIYFGNGVWNDYSSASDNRDALERQIISRIYHGDHSAFKSHHYTDREDPDLNKNIVLLAFNWTGSSPSDDLSFKSKVEDLIETFYQLKDNDQLEGYGLYESLKFWLTKNPNTPVRDILFDKIDDIVSEYSRAIEGANLLDMIEQYENISLKKSHRVLLVAHSQGNLFGNEVYDNLIPWEQGYFKMVSVATPSDNVLGKGSPYTTLTCDQIIEKNMLLRDGIPGHLPADVNCTGEEKSEDAHQFIPNYLSNHLSLHKILEDISQSLDQLSSTPSQWKIVKEPEDRSSCEAIRVEMAHRFDESLGPVEGVYPFETDAAIYKLYPAADEAGASRYVLDRCGGKTIKEDWEDKKENACYLLDPLGDVIQTGNFVYYLQMGRPSASVYSTVLYLCRADLQHFATTQECITAASGAQGDGYSIWDLFGEGPCQGYDRYADSKWAGTEYAGIFNDMILTTVPFEKASGWVCSNYNEGCCTCDGNNFKTYYQLSWSDLFANAYETLKGQ